MLGPCRIEFERESVHRGSRQAGQIFLVFAIAMLALVPLTGVVLDGGNLYLQRRTAQASADAAAIAGARALKQITSAPISNATVGTEVCKYAVGNVSGTAPTVTAAYFVGVDGTTNVGDITLAASCVGVPSNTTIPATASGVRVEVSIGPVNTKLIGMVGISTITATGQATAQIGTVTPDALNAPFVVCGVSTRRTDNTVGNILQGSGPTYTRIDPAAIGLTYKIYGATAPLVAKCSGSATWYGLGNMANNAGRTVPGPLHITGATNTANLNVTLQTSSGCTGSMQVSPCILYLPIASNPTTGTGNTQMDAVVWGAFEMGGNSTSRTGKLLGMVANAPKVFNWLPGSTSVTTIGLTN